jgi:hypothetical protein
MGAKFHGPSEILMPLKLLYKAARSKQVEPIERGAPSYPTFFFTGTLSHASLAAFATLGFFGCRHGVLAFVATTVDSQKSETTTRAAFGS